MFMCYGEGQWQGEGCGHPGERGVTGVLRAGEQAGWPREPRENPGRSRVVKVRVCGSQGAER